MNNKHDNPFIQFSLFNLMVVMCVGGVFAMMMRIYGVDRILPWAFLTGLILFLFAVGRWMIENVKNAGANDPSAPRKLATFNTNLEAEIMVSRLAEFGIKATAVGGFVSGFQAESPGYVDVVVTNLDFDNAEKVVASWDDGMTEHQNVQVQPDA